MFLGLIHLFAKPSKSLFPPDDLVIIFKQMHAATYTFLGLPLYDSWHTFRHLFFIYSWEHAYFFHTCSLNNLFIKSKSVSALRPISKPVEKLPSISLLYRYKS